MVQCDLQHVGGRALVFVGLCLVVPILANCCHGDGQHLVRRMVVDHDDFKGALLACLRVLGQFMVADRGEVLILLAFQPETYYTLPVEFEWNEEKAKTNLRKHGVSFLEARTVFGDPFGITIPDPLHSASEERHIELGYSNQERLLVVVYTERRSHIRIISARTATGREREAYEQS